MIWAICGELYPARYRAISIGIATAANWTWNFLISFFTPFISASIDYAYGYVFAGCCFTGIFVTYFFVNETQGRTLEEVDTMYVLHVTPWKSAEWEAPEGIIDDMHPQSRAGSQSGPKGGVGAEHRDEPEEIRE